MTTGSITEYIGRTVDLAGYHGIRPQGEVRLVESLAESGEGGAIITGVQKVAQRVLIELLKEPGSQPFRENEGTTFLLEARIGRFQTQPDVVSAFSRGIASVRATIQADELETDPADERFVDAPIDRVVVAPGIAVIFFTIVTRAGRNRDFIFPLKIPLRGGA